MYLVSLGYCIKKINNIYKSMILKDKVKKGVIVGGVKMPGTRVQFNKINNMWGFVYLPVLGLGEGLSNYSNLGNNYVLDSRVQVWYDKYRGESS